MSGRWLEEAARNLRHGARQLRRNPAFAATAIGTLALAIGANTTIFSVVDAVLLRTSRPGGPPAPPADIAAGVRRAIEAVDPLLPVAGFRSLEQVRASAMAGPRFEAVLLAALSGLALLLAALGLYGLIAQAVAERRRELGIRIALGSTAGQAVRAVALPGIALAAAGAALMPRRHASELAGVALGCLLSPLVVKLAMHLVWGVSAGDPATFAGVGAVLLAISALASLLPARKVTKLDPARVLQP